MSEPPPPVSQRLLTGACVPAMALLADDPQNGPARGGEQAPRPLDGRRIDPVLRVAEPDAGVRGTPRRSRRCRRGRGGASRRAGSTAGAKQPVSGFSTITCLPARAAATASGAWSVVGTQRSTTSTSGAASTSSALAATAADAELLGEAPGPLRPGRRDAGERHRHAVDLVVRLGVQARGETGADQPDPDRRGAARHRRPTGGAGGVACGGLRGSRRAPRASRCAPRGGRRGRHGRPGAGRRSRWT